MEQIEVRMNTLESIVKEIAHQQLKTEISIHELSAEMKVFKDEMDDFKEEGRRFREDLREDRKEMKQWRRNSELQWGRLANKWGTFVEDVAAPNIKRIGRDVFEQGDPDYFAVNVETKCCEIDVLAVYKTLIIINESKSSPRTEHVDQFLSKIEIFLSSCSEYKRDRIIPVFSSLRLDESFVSYLTKRKVFALAMGEYTMDLLNAKELLPEIDRITE